MTPSAIPREAKNPICKTHQCAKRKCEDGWYVCIKCVDEFTEEDNDR